MHSLAKHYHQMVGLDDDWAIDNVELDMESQTLSLTLEFIGSKVECSTLCAKKLAGAVRVALLPNVAILPTLHFQSGQLPALRDTQGSYQST